MHTHQQQLLQWPSTEQWRSLRSLCAAAHTCERPPRQHSHYGDLQQRHHRVGIRHLPLHPTRKLDAATSSTTNPAPASPQRDCCIRSNNPAAHEAGAPWPHQALRGGSAQAQGKLKLGSRPPQNSRASSRLRRCAMPVALLGGSSTPSMMWMVLCGGKGCQSQGLSGV